MPVLHVSLGSHNPTALTTLKQDADVQGPACLAWQNLALHTFCNGITRQLP